MSSRQLIADLECFYSIPPLFHGQLFLDSAPFIDFTDLGISKVNISELSEKILQSPENYLAYFNSLSLRRLGRYSEVLTEIILSHSPDITFHRQGLQIGSKKETYGEMDFIFSYQDKVIHLEQAMKFFIQSKSSSEWSDFIGPGGVDRLDKKMDKLLWKQSKISETLLAKKILSEENLPDITHINLLTKGWFFYHLSNLEKNDCTIPKVSNSEHYKGWWLYDHEFSFHFQAKDKFQILQRPFWLVPPLVDKTQLLSRDEMLVQCDLLLTNLQGAILVVRNEVNLPKSHGFILNSKWPEPFSSDGKETFSRNPKEVKTVQNVPKDV